MKTAILLAVWFGSLSFLLLKGHGQGAFQNFGFESAPVNLGGGVYTIPHWNATMGPYQGGVMLNNYVLDATTVSLQSISATDGFSPIDGNISVLLTASSLGYPLSTASISQTGIVPTTAKSLHFKVADVMAFQLPPDLPGQFFVTVNGQNVPLQAVGNYGSYSELAGNISNWAGQTNSISIGVSVPASQGPEIYFQGLIDDISFSPTSVPEPAVPVLAILASGCWLLYRRPARAGLS